MVGAEARLAFRLYFRARGLQLCVIHEPNKFTRGKMHLSFGMMRQLTSRMSGVDPAQTSKESMSIAASEVDAAIRGAYGTRGRSVSASGSAEARSLMPTTGRNQEEDQPHTGEISSTARENLPRHLPESYWKHALSGTLRYRGGHLLPASIATTIPGSTGSGRGGSRL